MVVNDGRWALVVARRDVWESLRQRMTVAGRRRLEVKGTRVDPLLSAQTTLNGDLHYTQRGLACHEY